MTLSPSALSWEKEVMSEESNRDEEGDMRDDATVRRDAEMWALVAELEAEKTRVLEMKIHNKTATDGTFFGAHCFKDSAVAMEDIAKKLREV